MVGGIWDASSTAQSFLPLDDDLDISKAEKAKTMLEMLVWDPSLKRRNALSVCSLPIRDSFAGVGGTKRGNHYMLEVVGTALSHSSSLIKAVVCDSHGSHCFIKKCLFGNLDGLNLEDIRAIPFFGQLQYEFLEPNCLPRLPIMICKHHGEIVYGLPGACYLDIIIQATSESYILS